MWTCVQVLADYWLLTTSFLPLLFTDYVISSSSSTDQTVRVIVSLPLLIGWCFFFHEFIYNLTTTSFFITSSHLLHITCSCFKHGVDCCFIFQKKKMVLLRNKFLTVKYRIQIFPLKDNDCVFGICACRLHPTLCDTRQQFYLTGISSSEFTYICTCLWFCILIMGL